MFFILAIIILSLDQLSKIIICRNLALHQSIPVIKGFFHLTLVHNRGAAFGILRNQIPVFLITSGIAMVMIIRSLKNSHGRLYRLSLWLILSGAAGNLVDRITFGYVIDFLDFRIWPVFNLADSAITIGAILLGWNLLTKKTAHSVNS